MTELHLVLLIIFPVTLSKTASGVPPLLEAIEGIEKNAASI